MRLAYLRIEDIPAAFDYILINHNDIIETPGNENLHDFIAYFRKQWMDHTPLALWNISNSLDHPTNNEVEGWHYYIEKKLLNGNKPLKFWLFIEKIGKEEYLVKEELAQLQRGTLLTSRSRVAKHKALQIKRMSTMYMNDELVQGDRLANIKAYLRGLTT
jgi:hypothetical protein